MPLIYRRASIATLCAIPFLYAAIAILLGKKTGWDLYNYHWYNPYAWLTNRFEIDVAVAHHATYYNPLADVPLYLLGTQGPAWLGGAFMGGLAGVAVALIAMMAHRALPGEWNPWRFALLGVIAILSTCGAGAFQEIGDPANDIPMAIGAFAAIVLLLRWLVNAEASAWRIPLLAGVCAGVFVALKLTTAVYALGVIGGLLLAGGAIRRRLIAVIACSGGIAFGMIAIGGFWQYKLWRFSGNPFFPYFNDVLHSPLLLADNYRDLNFRPDSWLSALLYPWQFTIESRLVSESVFRDARILTLYVLIPATLAIRAFIARGDARSLPDTTKFLFAFAAVSYIAWLAVFGIYRYLIPLEMLAPLVIAVAVASLPFRPRLQVILGVCALLIMQTVVRVDLSDRQSWSGKYVDVTAPRIDAPRDTMILMTGHAPMSYVIPYFPAEVPFVRIESWLVAGDDRTSGLALAMRARIAAHDGKLYVLFEDGEVEMARAASANYSLRLSEQCSKVNSNINAALWLCEARRI